MFRFLLAASVVVVFFTSSLSAQTNLRTQFNEALSMFNELVMQKDIGAAIDLVRVDEVLSSEAKTEANAKLIEAIADPFVGNATVRSETLKGGFRHQLLSYWTDSGDYFYVYLVIHTRNNVQHVVQADYSTIFTKFISRF